MNPKNHWITGLNSGTSLDFTHQSLWERLVKVSMKKAGH